MGGFFVAGFALEAARIVAFVGLTSAAEDLSSLLSTELNPVDT